MSSRKDGSVDTVAAEGAEEKVRSPSSHKVSFDLGGEPESKAEQKEAEAVEDEDEGGEQGSEEKVGAQQEEEEEPRRPRCMKRSKASEQARAQRMRQRIQEANAGGRIQDLHDEVCPQRFLCGWVASCCLFFFKATQLDSTDCRFVLTRLPSTLLLLTAHQDKG